MEYEGFSLYFNVLPKGNKVGRFLFWFFLGKGSIIEQRKLFLQKRNKVNYFIIRRMNMWGE